MAAAGTLIACGQTSPQKHGQDVPTRRTALERVPCAHGKAELAPICTLERERTATGQRWTIRHPDGGFRRLVVTGDEIETADGAALLRAHGNEAVVGDERYRLPTR